LSDNEDAAAAVLADDVFYIGDPNAACNPQAPCYALATITGLAIVLSVLGLNLIGDWRRDVLDPRLKL
jgi:hypothetical protein